MLVLTPILICDDHQRPCAEVDPEYAPAVGMVRLDVDERIRREGPPLNVDNECTRNIMNYRSHLVLMPDLIEVTIKDTCRPVAANGEFTLADVFEGDRFLTYHLRYVRHGEFKIVGRWVGGCPFRHASPP